MTVDKLIFNLKLWALDACMRTGRRYIECEVQQTHLAVDYRYEGACTIRFQKYHARLLEDAEAFRIANQE